MILAVIIIREIQWLIRRQTLRSKLPTSVFGDLVFPGLRQSLNKSTRGRILGMSYLLRFIFGKKDRS